MTATRRPWGDLPNPLLFVLGILVGGWLLAHIVEAVVNATVDSVVIETLERHAEAKP